MTVWNDEQRSEQLAHTTWMANTAVLMHLNERATGDPARDWLSSWAHRWFVGNDLRVLVLGCGEGWLERAVAQWPFVAHIDAVDFAEHAVARASEAARGIEKIAYGVVDLNRDELPSDAYDVVVAHSVLHHVENLEHAYAQIERTMRANATLIVNEYVGPRRFQFSDDVLSIMNALLACIGHAPRQRPTVEEMIANDPTEAVRSDELLAFTSRHFEVLERKDVGGTILQHLLFNVVQDFRFDVPRERAILEILCTIEAILVDSGRVPCDYVILAARKRGSQVTRANRPLPPRAEGANDVERDPLWSAQATPALSKAEALPPHSKARLIRLALLAMQPKRANLYRESRIAAAIPRRTKPHDDPQIECLLHTAAKLAGE
ncbi:MAG TPA: class I SAM-dependent methyltransferase [Thermoanaerobaculia bacterium]|jgi:SAM-dependent methyltransferase|nr:class I SAM-dependent methyltransferase [Thermoanaerobaculia bacterium]